MTYNGDISCYRATWINTPIPLHWDKTNDIEKGNANDNQ
jgi:hypothetical protein